MPTTPPKKVLLVEGKTELRLIPELIEQRGVTWGVGPRREHVVEIKVAGGQVTNRDPGAEPTERGVMAPNYIGTQLKGSGLEALGVVFDADGMNGRADNRWERMKRICVGMGITLPDQPAPEGFAVVLPGGVRFGAWMMPDNQPPGMLETFLLRLLSAEETAGPLFQHARASVDRARELGAPYREVHRDKALVHTWLSWQDPPGAQLHEAIKFRILDARSPNADGFVNWFRRLFEV